MMGRISGGMLLPTGLFFAAAAIYSVIVHADAVATLLFVLAAAIALGAAIPAVLGRAIWPTLLLWLAVLIFLLGYAADPADIDQFGWPRFLLTLFYIGPAFGLAVAEFWARRRRRGAAKAEGATA